MNITSFSNAADYIKGASNFFLTAFETGANAYERVANRIQTLKDPEKETETETGKLGFLASIAQDKEKAIAILAAAILAGGLILAARK